ncbi:class I SAM-dependent methyltransferase [Nakamurella lactea]|uniref:class I SAM-dependent methyltransferase n=1 Tax=Nakamurella lactea TaxID=459515 RepID=UPI00042A8AB1|nr:class I SAM-dependent methyltransferase [Nakamurella lactea]
MTERSRSFGSAAAAYERFRPGYPDELVDHVLGYAGRPVRTALEIGAGTGKATRAFAGRGIAVTASEPDPAMLEELRTHLPATVTTVLAAFEELIPIDHGYDLVYAAAALHWTAARQRPARIAALLAPGGTFASFGGQLQPADPDVAAAVRAARSAVVDSDEIPSPDGTPPEDPMQWPGSELIRSGRFIDVQQLTVQRRMTISADDYLGHLTTVSAYLTLAESARVTVLQRIRRALPDSVRISADLTVHLARKA